MTVIKLANESALGVYMFTWTSPATGYRCGIIWSEGAGDPIIEWTCPSGQHIHRMIAAPERFGWTDPSGKPAKRQLAVVQDFARTYAEAAEAAATEDDDDAEDDQAEAMADQIITEAYTAHGHTAKALAAAAITVATTRQIAGAEPVPASDQYL